MAKNPVIVASLSPNLYTTKRLIEESTKLKHSAFYINPYQTHLSLKTRPSQGLYFHRTTGTNYDDFDLVVTKHHENQGLKVTNPLAMLKLFRSKDQQALFFNEFKLPAIPTLLYRGEMTESLEKEIEKIGSQSQKYILKMNRGNQGIGVNFLESKKSLQSVLETFLAMKDQRFLIQPFIAHKKEWRIFIIKGKVMACIEKTISKEDFRGNAKRSSGKILKRLPVELEKIATDAFIASGLDYAGIDLLCSDKGEILLLEINPIPGFEQAEALSGNNIARELILELK